MSDYAYSRVRVGKDLSDRFPIRNGLKQVDALSPLPFNFALEWAIRTVQVNVLQGPHKCSAFTSMILRLCSGILFHIHSYLHIYFCTRA